MTENSKTLLCPECESEMSFQGYRPMFPKCTSCGNVFHLDKCVMK